MIRLSVQPSDMTDTELADVKNWLQDAATHHHFYGQVERERQARVHLCAVIGELVARDIERKAS